MLGAIVESAGPDVPGRGGTGCPGPSLSTKAELIAAVGDHYVGSDLVMSHVVAALSALFPNGEADGRLTDRLKTAPAS